MTHHLIGLQYSPWTVKARWVLEYQSISYHYSEYLIRLGEPWIRIKTKNFTRPVSVPVLVTPGEQLEDSFAIAQWANANGEKNSLFPDPNLRQIREWNQWAETLSTIGRKLVIGRVCHSNEALRESVPEFMPQFPGLTHIARSVAGYVQKKYSVDGNTNVLEQKLTEHLTRLRESIENREYLSDAFSYADITTACALQFVSPVEQRYIQLGSASAAAWKHSRLDKDFGDVFEWRDKIFVKHYPQALVSDS